MICESIPMRRASGLLALFIAAVLTGAAPAALAKDRPSQGGAADAKADKTRSDKAKAEKNDKASDKSKDDAGGATMGKAEQLGSFGDWEAYAADAGKDRTCYAVGKPKDRQPKAKLKDTTAYIFISTRPAENVRNEFAVNLGYATKDGSAAAAEIDSDAFELITKGSNAWIREQAREKEFVGALRGGAKLLVKATSAKGTATVDTYSLKGLSEALARVNQECK